MRNVALLLCLILSLDGTCQFFLQTKKDSTLSVIKEGDTISLQPLILYQTCFRFGTNPNSVSIWSDSSPPIQINVRKRPLGYVEGDQLSILMWFMPLTWCKTTLFHNDFMQLDSLSLSDHLVLNQLFEGVGYRKMYLQVDGSNDTAQLVLDLQVQDANFMDWRKKVDVSYQIKKKRFELMDSIDRLINTLPLTIDSARQVVQVCASSSRILKILQRQSAQNLIEMDSAIQAVLPSFDLPSRIKFYDLYYKDLNHEWQLSDQDRVEKIKPLMLLHRMRQWLPTYEYFASKQKERQGNLSEGHEVPPHWCLPPLHVCFLFHIYFGSN